MADTIQIRRDTAANWASVNPVLAQGEMGLETDTERMKLGDGVTAYNSLNYFVTSQTNVGITGGTIDGTVIGGSTAAAGTFTSLTADGLTVDGNSVFTTADNSAQVTLISTDTDALVGPQLNLWRNSGAGTNGDLIGQITFTGEDTVGSTNTFASIYSVADQTNNGSEDGSIHFQTLINGVLEDRFEINSAGNSVFTGTVTATGTSVFASLDISGDIDVDGTTNLDVVDIDGAVDMASTLTVGGTTDDGTTLVQIIQSGTGRGFSVTRNVVSATRAIVNLAQFNASGGAEAVLDIQQTASASRAIKVTPDGSIDRFSVYGTGALVTTPVAGGHAVFNEGGVDADFRVESDTNTHALFVEGSSGNVGIGTSSPTTALDVVGTVTADGLSTAFLNGDTNVILTVDADNNQTGKSFVVQDGSGKSFFKAEQGGDISFYEDTGTTAKFFWDASAETISIGTGASSTATISAYSRTVSASLPSALRIIENTGASSYWDIGSTGGASNNLNFYANANTTPKMTLTGAGNVGIGTSSPATTLDVAGTVTMDGGSISGNLLIGTSLSSAKLTVGTFGDTARAAQFHGGSILIDGGAASEIIIGDGNAAYMSIQTTDDATAMKIRNYSGSADLVTVERVSGNVGIGTSSPQASLTVAGGLPAASSPATYAGTIQINETALSTLQEVGGLEFRGAVFGSGYGSKITSTDTGSLLFGRRSNNVSWSESMRIDSSGNVGINETVPFGKLHISDTQTGRTTAGTVGNLLVLEDDENGMSILSADAGAGYILFGDTASASSGGISYEHSANKFNFRTNDAWNRMILDSSGNLLVGKTTTAFGTQGIRLEGSNGKIEATRNGNIVMALNRLTSDGTIAEFAKDGTTVGSIGAIGSDLYVGTGDTGLRFLPSSDAILPAQGNTGATRDDAIDIGTGTARFDDIYATNGTIQTSDRNEKQDIEVLSEAEQRVAVACKGLLRKFRWKSSVEEKGDDARIHFGIIAQDLQAAFEAEGLDAGRYAMFIHSTWTDEETGEERSRMGVRYSELLAFIIAAI